MPPTLNVDEIKTRPRVLQSTRTCTGGRFRHRHLDLCCARVYFNVMNMFPRSHAGWRWSRLRAPSSSADHEDETSPLATVLEGDVDGDDADTCTLPLMAMAPSLQDGTRVRCQMFHCKLQLQL